MDRRMKEKIKEIVSIAAAVAMAGDLESPPRVHDLDRAAFEIAHRIELVLQHRAEREALED
jgi:hypothetical protein